VISTARGVVLSLWLLTTALPAKAQPCTAGPSTPIATDRPQVTSSSVVVPCGSLQFENGFQLTGNEGQHTYDLPETSVRFGILAKTELRLGVPDYFYNDAVSSGSTKGLGDLTIGFKTQLGPTRGGFDVSVVPTLSLPAGANRISSHGYDPSVQLPWSHAIGKNWAAAGMFSLLWPTETGRRNLTGQASFYLDRQLLAPLDAYCEYSGAVPQRGGPQHSIDFGVAYKPSPHQQLDFHSGFGLSAATSDYTVGFGYSVRFQVIRSR
jgi:hypothetical protein